MKLQCKDCNDSSNIADMDLHSPMKCKYNGQIYGREHYCHIEDWEKEEYISDTSNRPGE